MTPERALQTIQRIDETGSVRGQHSATLAYARRVVSAAAGFVELIRESGADLGTLSPEERALVRAVEGIG